MVDTESHSLIWEEEGPEFGGGGQESQFDGEGRESQLGGWFGGQSNNMRRRESYIFGG